MTFSSPLWGSPLAYAIEFGLVHLFDELFLGIGNVDMRFSNGYTLLTWAARYGQTAIVERLLDLQAEPDLIEMCTGKRMSALHIAAELAHHKLAVLILERGATADLRSRSGASPFYRAVRSGSIAIMELLRNAGADINVRTWDNWTPVFEAVRFGRAEALNLLLSWGADPSVRIHSGETFISGYTPLSLAEERGFSGISQSLRMIFTKQRDSQANLQRFPLPDNSVLQDVEENQSTGQHGGSSGRMPLLWMCCTCGSDHSFFPNACCCTCGRPRCNGCVITS